MNPMIVSVACRIKLTFHEL